MSSHRSVNTLFCVRIYLQCRIVQSGIFCKQVEAASVCSIAPGSLDVPTDDSAGGVPHFH